MAMIGTSRLLWNWALCLTCRAGERDLSPWRRIGDGADAYKETKGDGSLGVVAAPELIAMLMLPEAEEDELLLGIVGGGFAAGGWSVPWAFGSGSFSGAVAFGGGGCNAGLVPGECSAARASIACWSRTS